MPVSSFGPKGAELVSFGLAALALVLTPSAIGHQDLASLIAQQPAVAERWRQHLATSPFGTVQATFHLPRPVGTAMPEPPRLRLASLATGDVTGSIGPAARGPGGIVYPTVDRSRKGDRWRPPAPPASETAPPDAASPPPGAPAIEAHNGELPDIQLQVELAIRAEANAVPPAIRTDEIEAAMRIAPFPEFDLSLSLELSPELPAEEVGEAADVDPADLYPNAPPDLDGLNAELRADRLYFGAAVFGDSVATLTPWAAGEEPVLMLPRAADPEIKLAALAPSAETPHDPGVTVAGKGEVTGDGRRPKSPAERLGLVGAKRAKAEKCLANAVYFESRGEPVRGQIAVAQVVLNRAFSGYYPSDVCGVVYQNAHRRLACQFTFACDGIPDRVADAEAWTRAQRIAKESLDGRLWLADVGKSTHYHANYVRPWWRRTMRTLSRIGVHIFYRPRKWGDGEDAPIWGSATYTAEAAKTL